MEEIENVLGIRYMPMNYWPIGINGEYKGVYDRDTKLSSSLRKGQKLMVKKTSLEKGALD